MNNKDTFCLSNNIYWANFIPSFSYYISSNLEFSKFCFSTRDYFNSFRVLFSKLLCSYNYYYYIFIPYNSFNCYYLILYSFSSKSLSFLLYNVLKSSSLFLILNYFLFSSNSNSDLNCYSLIL